MQKLNKDLASYLLEFIDFYKYKDFFNQLYPGSYLQFYNKNLKFIQFRDRCEYRLSGMIHREDDQPAVTYLWGTKIWYQNNKIHRDNDQPAVIYLDGTKEWYKNNRLHREYDQPAIIRGTGTKEWWLNGKRHRDGYKPNIIMFDDNQYEYYNGQKC